MRYSNILIFQYRDIEILNQTDIEILNIKTLIQTLQYASMYDFILV